MLTTNRADSCRSWLGRSITATNKTSAVAAAHHERSAVAMLAIRKAGHIGYGAGDIAKTERSIRRIKAQFRFCNHDGAIRVKRWADAELGGLQCWGRTHQGTRGNQSGPAFHGAPTARVVEGWEGELLNR